jgi:hypothetical protein
MNLINQLYANTQINDEARVKVNNAMERFEKVQGQFRSNQVGNGLLIENET